HAQHSGLDLVQPRVVAHVLKMPFIPRTVKAERARQLGQLVVVGGYRAAVAETAEVLRRVEGDRRDVAQRAGAPAVPPRPERLGGILEHRQPELVERFDWS